ncbi:hypothetical protein DUT91_13590 [Phyllobacterium salinisoli]|uniref:Lytic murein transglycosylase n=1 Tax=Phyllobacterium salinisoli TaxID=1899321 RepID=A0A368K5N5_9HYPH|nr:hypothetical protein DUT91_13590 [Phyllobacterium salinisoli]
MISRKLRRDSAPLWLASHLPREGGDQPVITASPDRPYFKIKRRHQFRPISPLAGEMSGRTEGRAVPPALLS